MRKLRYPVIAAILLIDHLIKFIVRKNMYCGQSIPVIDGVFSITYVQNRGAAFNMFDGQNVFLTVVPLMALLLAVWYMEKHKDGHWTLLLSMALIIAGGLGNLIDRFALGFVTDMIDAQFVPAFPVFNVADIAICVGCGFLLLYMFAFDKTGKPDKSCQTEGETPQES